MADKINKTTSSTSVYKAPVNMTNTTSSHTPNAGEAQIVTRLAANITESYRMLTQKQQKFNDLASQHQHYHQQHLKRIHTESSNNAKLLKSILKAPATDEWQEVCSTKNKLKRKKTLSASLTSVTDSVNQEKRTRIEGMQLNCRGRLHIKENMSSTSPASPTSTPVPLRSDKLAGKPPLPPSSKLNSNNTESKSALNPPPRLKRKLQENVQTIQKLNALTEQLRLEINELKSSLTTEKGAVRVLRAQNESEARKWKHEVKKLQHALELLKKAGGVHRKCDATNANNENLPQATAMGGLVNYEIQRLTNEINNLKEANKAFEEKKVINCDADRRKAADIRELRDSYEIRLTHIQKSAKNEISRLLEEIKSKERNIGQLKKDLQILQNSKNASRNATTLNNTNQTNKTTNSKNQIYKKPKSSSHRDANKQNEEPSKESATSTTKNKDITKKADSSLEISKLKNIELINNTKNVTTNHQKPTKILASQQNNEKESEAIESSNGNKIKVVHNTHFKALQVPELPDSGITGHSCCRNVLHQKQKPLLLTTATQTIETNVHATMTAAATATATTQTPNTTTATFLASSSASIASDETDHFDEQHITQELTQHLENNAIQDAKEHHHRHRRHHHHHQHQHHHHHNSHSDSDSALSSAPTSISPQPPANGEEPTDFWQTMRSYTHDIEKLQKEIELMQKQNEELNKELNLAKEQITEFENNAMETANNSKIPQLMERIKYLEDQEHHLAAEANDLREQNELLEFRILELEETNDKWSLQSHTNPTSKSSDSLAINKMASGTQNLWSCQSTLNHNNNNNGNKPDPFEILFGSKSHTNTQLDSGIISPQSQQHHDDLIDISNEELCRRLADLLKKPSLEEGERHCLQQVFNLVQQLDALTPRSGPNSLNANSSSDETSSLDLVKSRISDYSSASSTSTSSNRSADDSNSANSTKANTSNSSSNLSAPSRIVATIQPYNSSLQLAPHNTPTDSPRKARCQPWQTNSLSESGVFVESDFYSDISENNVCTQTDFEDGGIAPYSTHHIFSSPTKKVPVQQKNSATLTDLKRLQYYRERAEILEGKVLIYESSGDVQAKRLAERLQREIQLEKEVNDLRNRVEFLESENANLEEEKCEFEEAENDTRLRLQRLEVELEILSQRNVELEMSREAQSAKYKDCHSECLILREDLAASETQIRHLEEDKQKAKENLEFLHNTLPLLLIYNTYCTLAQAHDPNYRIANVTIAEMGNQSSSSLNLVHSSTSFADSGFNKDFLKSPDSCMCHDRELQVLKEEVRCLRHNIKELNTRHYAALESADSHWVDLEREYKEREELFQSEEMCLKQKIQKLQDCLKEDARSATEKICQLEEAEQSLKTSLVKVSKEHQKLQEDYHLMMTEFDRFKEQHEQERAQQKPLTEALECEKKRNKALSDELTYMRKLQQETESQAKKDLELLGDKMFDLRKDYLHIEVTNGELKEEVTTLEIQIRNLEKALQESEEKIRCLTDEIRTKDEICQKLEKRLERTEGYSLADELCDSPSKRFKREDVKDLKSASKGLGQALRHMGECERMLPSQKQFKTIARDVKKLADSLLQGDATEEETQIPNENKDSVNKAKPQIMDSQKSDEIETNFKDESRESLSYDNLPSEMIKQNEKEMKQEETFSEIFYRNNTDNSITVATALISPSRPDEIIMNSPSPLFPKKAICEVPSELRKLANPPNTEKPLLDFKDESHKTQQRLRVPRKGKRGTKRRLTRGRVSSFHLKVNRMVTRLLYGGSSIACQVESDNKSEILQRNISYSSFHSLHEEINEPVDNSVIICEKVDVCVECNIQTETKEATSNTAADKSDFGIQVNDEISVQLQLHSVPQHVRCFLDLLTSADVNAKVLLNSSVFSTKVCLRWKSDAKFQHGLDILAKFVPSISNSTDSSCTCFESYEDFVSVMNCLQVLEDLLKPNKIAMLKTIETEINEHLMVFHNQQKESEFYCTVYYPVERKCGLNFEQTLKNV